MGLLAYGELSAFDRMADDARMAPEIGTRAALSEIAASRMAHYHRFVGRITDFAADPVEAMQPFVEAVETFHVRTDPSTWGEALVKAFVGDGLASDFFREVADFVDADTRGIVIDSLTTPEATAFVMEQIRLLTATDRAATDRLSLWARRLVGEAITQTQRVSAERDALAMLIVGGAGDLAGIGRMINRITKRHTDRMTEIGLSN
jgi:tRNA-(MS[2]IO[6]A)-hydroxylase (MiaE)-like